MSVFILTVNPRKSGDDDEAWDAAIAADGLPDLITYGRWSTGSRKSGIEPGDVLLMLRQGGDRRGIVAILVACGEIYQDTHWEDPGKDANYVDLRALAAVSIDDRIPTEWLQSATPVAPSVWTPQGSGTQVPQDAAGDVMAMLWQEWLSLPFVAALPSVSQLPTLSHPELLLPAAALGVEGTATMSKSSIRRELQALLPAHRTHDAWSPSEEIDLGGDEFAAFTRTVIDAARKAAIERYAMDAAIEVLQADGYDVSDVAATESWDLEAARKGHTITVEVKGSTVMRDRVDLTRNEVDHAQRTKGTMLIVVDDIDCDDTDTCSGGRIRTWGNWHPRGADLSATVFSYTLPDDDDQGL